MIFRRTILNVAAGAFIIGCVVYTVFNYNGLSAGEGWGIIYMLALCGLGCLLLIIDFVIQNVFRKNKLLVMVLDIIVLLLATMSLFLKG